MMFTTIDAPAPGQIVSAPCRHDARKGRGGGGSAQNLNPTRPKPLVGFAPINPIGDLIYLAAMWDHPVAAIVIFSVDAYAHRARPPLRREWLPDDVGAPSPHVVAQVVDLLRHPLVLPRQ